MDPVPLDAADRALVASLLDEARAATTSRTVGEIGEAIAQVWLVAQGWALVHQDLGERGVDALHLDLAGDAIVLTEVKTTRTGAAGFRTSRRGSLVQATDPWVRQRLADGGYAGLETVVSMAFRIVGVKVDTRAGTIRLYERASPLGRPWRPITGPIPLA